MKGFIHAGQWIATTAIAAILVTGCAKKPVVLHKHVKHYPKKACVTRCLTNKKRCDVSCRSANEQCLGNAMYIGALKAAKIQKLQKAKRHVAQYVDSSQCYSRCGCTPSRLACYQVCGGIPGPENRRY